MRQTLIRIPLDAPWSIGPFEVPGFGFGLLFWAWVAVAAVWLWRFRKELRLGAELVAPVLVWLFVAVVIVRVPKFVHAEEDRAIIGATAAINSGEARAAAWLARARAYDAKREAVPAAEDYRAALERDPDLAEAHRDLAWLLATSPDDDVRNGAAAVEHALAAVSLSGSDRITLDTLAAAYAEAGRFPEAIAAAKEAALLANESAADDATARLRGLRERLVRYENERPWREPRAAKFIPVYGYGFMMFLGFIVSGWWAVRRAATVGIPSDTIWDITLWVFFAGVVGSRLFYILQYPEQIFGDRTGISRILAVFNLPDGGLVLYGGVLLGIVAFLVACRWKRVSAPLLADVLIPSLLLGVGFGRIGCFLNGCCYGDRCDLPWSVTFPAGSVPDLSLVTQGFQAADEVVRRIALHPAQLYSALDGFLLAFLTAAYFPRRAYNGAVVTLGWLCYPVTRFLIEYVRDDEALVRIPLKTFGFWGTQVGTWQTPFTISQWVSLGLFAAGLAYLAWKHTRGRRAQALSR